MATFFTVMEVSECTSILQQAPPIGIEKKPITEALYCVLAEDIIAKEDIPLATRSCMDGYAVQSADTAGATEHSPNYLECIDSIKVEQPARRPVQQGECMEIVTGAILPQGADAVVMVEYTHSLGAGTVAVGKSVSPNEHCMLQGEDAKKGEVALHKGKLLRTQEIAFLATLGITEVTVYAKPTISLFSTGDEVIEPTEPLQIGFVRDANAYSIEALLRTFGCSVHRLPIVPDNKMLLEQHLLTALDTSDIVLLSGGSSVGSRDYTIEAIECLDDIEIITHGLAMQPGKPTIIAKKGKQYIIGLPGQIASAYCVLVAVVIPFIQHISGYSNAFDRKMWSFREAKLSRNIAGTPGRESWVRVSLTQNNGEYTASPVFGKSGLLRTLIATDGVVVIPSNTEGLEEGSIVQVYTL